MPFQEAAAELRRQRQVAGQVAEQVDRLVAGQIAGKVDGLVDGLVDDGQVEWKVGVQIDGGNHWQQGFSPRRETLPQDTRAPVWLPLPPSLQTAEGWAEAWPLPPPLLLPPPQLEDLETSKRARAWTWRW